MEVAKIRQISDKQAESVKQISDAVEQVNGVVQSNSATSEEVSATSEELLHLLKVWMRWYLILLLVK